MKNHYLYVTAILVLTVLFLSLGSITGMVSWDMGDLDALFNGKDEILLVQGTECNNDYRCRDVGINTVCRRITEDDKSKYCEEPGMSGDMCERNKDCTSGFCNYGKCLGDCNVNSDCISGKCVFRKNSALGDCMKVLQS